ncbi:MAG: 50S ribosomal protein L13 [Phycisphaerales bacterium]|nr:50S ribosomal protein L13 [Phycisphaerales bacterium]
MRRQTYYAKPGEIKQNWRIVDADGIPLGRLAAEIAIVLMGKHRPDYTPHVVSGDYVIVTNASKVELTGRKAEQRLRKWYTEFPSGLKTQTFGQVRQTHPERLIEDAVRRMLPKNRLSRVLMKNLKVYPGVEHPHTGSKPAELAVTR